MKVNWERGLDDSGRPTVNPEAYYETEPLTVYPTGGGAHNVSGPAADKGEKLYELRTGKSV